MEMKMRRARVEDAAAIRRIDQAMGGTMGLEIGQRPEDYYKEWLAYHRGRRHPAFVGTSGGEVVWWVALGESPGGYPFDGVATVEMGVPQQYSGTELTDLLLRFLEQQAIKLGYYKLMACLNGEQRYLLHIYRRVGFRDVGILRSHGYLRGKLVDLVLLERLLPQDMTALEEYYSGQYSFYQEYFQEERRRKALALQGEYELEYEEVETPEDQLPEGIVRFLRTKKAPDGTPLRRPASPSAGEDGSAGAEAPGEGEEALEEEPLPAPPQPQLPEGIVKFLKSKKAPDGTLAHPDLPPVVPVKLPSTQSSPSSPEENREAAPSPESV
ncbi:MAG: hypothetical protein HFF13_05005 [Angelakisella sp.]|jgi:L-amino acid N-acyltransferase YncA|nr:hypothetical protein [Angelakisella sp.]MCI9666604.1 hypothetical protein [Angelakisella sp.]